MSSKLGGLSMRSIHFLAFWVFTGMTTAILHNNLQDLRHGIESRQHLNDDHHNHPDSLVKSPNHVRDSIRNSSSKPRKPSLASSRRESGRRNSASALRSRRKPNDSTSRTKKSPSLSKSRSRQRTSSPNKLQTDYSTEKYLPSSYLSHTPSMSDLHTESSATYGISDSPFPLYPENKSSRSRPIHRGRKPVRPRFRLKESMALTSATALY